MAFIHLLFMPKEYRLALPRTWSHEYWNVYKNGHHQYKKHEPLKFSQHTPTHRHRHKHQYPPGAPTHTGTPRCHHCRGQRQMTDAIQHFLLAWRFCFFSTLNATVPGQTKMGAVFVFWEEEEERQRVNDSHKNTKVAKKRNETLGTTEMCRGKSMWILISIPSVFTLAEQPP